MAAEDIVPRDTEGVWDAEGRMERDKVVAMGKMNKIYMKKEEFCNYKWAFQIRKHKWTILNTNGLNRLIWA